MQQGSFIKQTYTVGGMDCGHCAATIERHLLNHAAVRTVDVQFATGKMQVEHALSLDIPAEVAKIGYSAAPVVSGSGQRQAPARDGRSALMATIVSGLTLALGFGLDLAGAPEWASRAFDLIALLFAGFKPAKSAIYAVKSKSLDMNVLMSAAAIGAVLLGQWQEGATVVWLFALGVFLQTRSIERTRQSIRSLMELSPIEAWVKEHGAGLVRTGAQDVRVGQHIVVKPGESVPLDGDVVLGQSSVNEAPITGESIPVDKQPGDPVYAGTVNGSGVLEILVTRAAPDTLLARIIHRVEEAQAGKAPAQAIIDRFAAGYTPIVFLFAILVMAVPPLAGWGTWADWLYKGLELLVVACPCALVISTPVALVSAIGHAAGRGVLIKNGAALERAGSLTVVAFDKTGTLTEGRPEVAQVLPADGIDERGLLAIVRTLEEHSTHPLAQALVHYAAESRVPSLEGLSFREVAGKGVQATIAGTDYFAGNPRLFGELGFSPEAIDEGCAGLSPTGGRTVVIVGTAQTILGAIAIADSLRSESVAAVRALRGAGIRQTVMLTGDREQAAKPIAGQAGIDAWYAGLLPEDKLRKVHELQHRGEVVAMVGDGVNDAPALAAADLGIAMGGAGSDTAMETADIVLMADSLERLPEAIRLSRRTLAIIRQNVAFSLLVKAVALAFIFTGWLTLWMAVLSDSGAALLVIANSLRLLRVGRKSNK